MKPNANVEKFIKALSQNNFEGITSSLEALMKQGEEDAIVAILYEAVLNGLETGGRVTYSISEIMIDYHPRRTIIKTLVDAIDDPINNAEDITAMMAKHFHFSLEEWEAIWPQAPNVSKIRKLFREYPIPEITEDIPLPPAE